MQACKSYAIFFWLIPSILSAILNRALRERGFFLISSPCGRIGLTVISRRVALCLHVHTGCRGGQMQSLLSWRINCFTMRSSNEWKEITASRPPGASAVIVCGRTPSSASSSLFTAMRNAWKVRVAGWIPLCPPLVVRATTWASWVVV